MAGGSARSPGTGLRAPPAVGFRDRVDIPPLAARPQRDGCGGTAFPHLPGCFCPQQVKPAAYLLPRKGAPCNAGDRPNVPFILYSMSTEDMGVPAGMSLDTS